jgi:hypothetical protein
MTRYKDGWVYPKGWGKNHKLIIPMSGVCAHEFVYLRENSETYHQFLQRLVTVVEAEMLNRGFHYCPDKPPALMETEDDLLKGYACIPFNGWHIKPIQRKKKL